MACWRILLALGKELNQGCSQMSRPPIPDVGIWDFWCSRGKKVEKCRLRVQICKLFACWPPELQVSRSSSLGLVSDLSYVYLREVVLMERMQFYTTCNQIQLWAEEREYSCIPFSSSKWVFPSKQQMASRVVTLLLWCKSGNVRWERVGHL